jgi:hypothetical protein
LYDLRVITTNVAGNISTSAAVRVEVQNGAPTPTGVQLLNGSETAGKIDDGDTIVATYSQSLHVNSLCPAWSAGGDGSNQTIAGNNDVAVTVADGGAANDTLTIGSTSCTFHFGAIGLGSPGFATGGGLIFGKAGVNKSTISWNQSAHTLTIVLGSKSGSGTEGTVTSAAAAYTPDAAITSAVGTAITGTFTTLNSKQF